MAETTKFTWTDKEDPEVLEKGDTIMWLAGSTKAINRFVETLSNECGHKADWAFQGGRAHIEMMPGGIDKALALIADEKWMSQFLVPYDMESQDPNANAMYMERLK